MEYVLKSMICLLVLLTIHRLWLQSEVFYRFNRFFLLGAVVFSFWIPSYTIQKVEMVEEKVVADASADRMESEPIIALGNVSVQPVSPIMTSSEFPWETVMWSLYGLISLIFLIRFLRNISILYNQIQQNLRVTYRGQTLVLLSERVVPFTFFRYIFVNRQEFEKDELSDAVLEHELAHVQGKHSWDILFIELLLVPFWFHPGLYWAKQSIQLNHEFIADQSALKKWPLHRYQQELLQFAAGKSANGLVSNLNFSLTKKRLEMMKKQSKPAIRAIKLLVLLPMIGLVIYGFSEKEVQTDTSIVKGTDNSRPLFKIHGDSTFDFEGKIFSFGQLENVLTENREEVRLVVGPGTSMEVVYQLEKMLEGLDVKKIEYVEVDDSNEKKTVQKMSSPQVQTRLISDQEYYENAYFLIEDSQMHYTHKTYSQLTEKQKGELIRPQFKGAEKMSPSIDLFEKFKDHTQYAVWVDDIVVQNAELDKYRAEDFYGFFDSYVYPNARSKRFPQEHQVKLYRKDLYLKLFGPDAEMFQPLSRADTITLTERRVTWHKDIQNYPDRTTRYLQIYANYEKLLEIDLKSDKDKMKLGEVYQQLKEMYFSSNPNWQKRVKKPVPPQGNSEA
ncbi:M56 family metallopeptidase [Algoriphagus vanfongensis]|uniref:M56 family metallopeptidase n=1 Tax=Algoriphagus vanfongensis TaxID=426371 RepID=UPI0003FB09F0|nr:M56 family metallopeptidase [Algoriphagus vanfongensis]